MSRLVEFMIFVLMVPSRGRSVEMVIPLCMWLLNSSCDGKASLSCCSFWSLKGSSSVHVQERCKEYVGLKSSMFPRTIIAHVWLS